MIAIIVIELNRQATFANNGVFVNPPDDQTAYTYSNFIVPPGQNRILVIGAMTNDGDINNITYNGIASVKAVSDDCCGSSPEERYYTAVWYVGSGGEINSNVAFNFNFTP